ncbi:MAG: PQQ-binding-like beta-propeller repeat protein [Actinotalea sp.]|nr:PQQ-binding-like beta-propeller repeat protein [Actinotalea sp.]
MDVLLEEDAPAAASAGPARPGEPSTRRRVTRARWLAVATGLVALVAVAAVGTVEDRRHAERLAAFAEIPGTVPPLDLALTERWSHPAGQLWRAGHLVLVGDPDGGGVRALDVRTGQEAWTLDRGEEAPVQRCLTDREARRAAVVLCTRGWSLGGPPGIVTHEVVDAEDGEVLRRYAAHLPSHGQAVAGTDVVSAQPEGDGAIVVTRARAGDGTPVWSTRVAGSGGRRAGGGAGTLRVQDGFVVLRGTTTAVLDAQDGALLGAWYPGGYTAVGSVPGLDSADVRTAADGFGAWSDAAAGSRGPSGTWFDRSGVPTGVLEGLLVDAAVSDGSEPDVRLTGRSDTGELVATDLLAGRELWRGPARGAHLLVRREGVVVLAVGQEVQALDLRTGAVRWAAEATGLAPRSGSVTDGATVVVLTHTHGRAQLLALDLDTGAVRWEVPAPGVGPLSERRHDLGHVALGEVAGVPVLLGDGVVVGLGPAPVRGTPDGGSPASR